MTVKVEVEPEVDPTTLLEATQKWPAAYSILACVMDDVSLDRNAAVEKWNGQVVALSETFLNRPLTHDAVELLLKRLGAALGKTLYNEKVVEVVANERAEFIVRKRLGDDLVESLPKRKSKPTFSYSSYEKVVGVITEVNELPSKFKEGETYWRFTVKQEGETTEISGTLPKYMYARAREGLRVRVVGRVSRKSETGWFTRINKMEVLT